MVQEIHRLTGTYRHSVPPKCTTPYTASHFIEKNFRCWITLDWLFLKHALRFSAFLLSGVRIFVYSMSLNHVNGSGNTGVCTTAITLRKCILTHWHAFVFRHKYRLLFWTELTGWIFLIKRKCVLYRFATSSYIQFRQMSVLSRNLLTATILVEHSVNKTIDSASHKPAQYALHHQQ